MYLDIKQQRNSTSVRVWVLLVPLWASCVTSGQTLFNVRARQLQEGPDAGRVEITYGLSGFPHGASVSVSVSTDGGLTYGTIPAASSLSGDRGVGVPEGSNRRILWDPLPAFGPAFGSSGARVAVSALPLTADGLSFFLTWGNCADLDLYVKEPDGTVIYWDNPLSGSFGRLEADSNAACSKCISAPLESIVWPAGPPRPGAYEVRAVNYQSGSVCAGSPATDFRIDVLAGGLVLESFLGTVPAGATSEVFSFSFQELAAATRDRAGDALEGSTLTLPSNVFSLDTRPCYAPLAPVLMLPSESVVSGHPFTVSWPQTAGTSGTYEVTLSGGFDCRTTLLTRLLRENTITLPGGSSETVTASCIQVAATNSRGCSSPPSAPGRIVREPLPARFEIIKHAIPTTWRQNGPRPKGPLITMRNTGAKAGDLALLGVPGFFSVHPSEAVAVPPGADVSVEVLFASEAVSQRGSRIGHMTASWPGGSLSAAVTLSIVEPSFAVTPGASLSFQGSGDIRFSQKGPANPAPQFVEIINGGDEPARIVPRIAPGGAWLLLEGDTATPLLPGASRTFRLSVDRSRRTPADGTFAVSTNLAFLNLGAPLSEAATAQVFDEEPASPSDGSNRPALPDGSFSLFVGAATSIPANNAFLSDGWLRNHSPSQAVADFYLTPDGANGAGAAVLRATVLLPPYGSLRLFNPVESMFGLVGVNGQLEIRSSHLEQLSLRATVEGLTLTENGLARTGAEIPVVTSGQGAKRNRLQPGAFFLVIPGLRDETSGFRSNIILFETSGQEITVLISLYGREGNLIGREPVTLPPSSKLQLNSAAAAHSGLFPPGSSYEGGTIEITAARGDGSVMALATIIDNASQSFAIRSAEVFRQPEFGPLSRSSWKESEGPAFLPAAVRATGLNGSFYTTRLIMANALPDSVTLELTYLPDSAPGHPVTRSVTLPGRTRGPRTIVWQDLLADLFGIQKDSQGMIRIAGNLSAVTVASETLTPIDSNHPGRGFSVASMNPAPGKPEWEANGVFSAASTEAIGPFFSEAGNSIVSLPSAAEGLSHRTNLILAELGGKPVEVRLRLLGPGSNGASLGEKHFALGPFQRLSRVKVIREILGLDFDDLSAEFQNLELQVEAVSGEGRVLAIATKVDNNSSSRKADIQVLGPPVSGR